MPAGPESRERTRLRPDRRAPGAPRAVVAVQDMWRLPYALIVLYRRWISPLLPAVCRFHPSCSLYAAQSLRRHGLWRGSALACRRVLRCHPWHPGGIDPVPERFGD